MKKIKETIVCNSVDTIEAILAVQYVELTGNDSVGQRCYFS